MIETEILTFLLLAVPLIASALILVAGKSRLTCMFISLISSLFTFILALLMVLGYTDSTHSSIYLNWITLSKLSVHFVFELSLITTPLLLIIAGISYLVHLYSFGIFKWDNQQPRYYATVNFFTFSMLGLTLSGNLIQLFLFWELVGLSSYLLISFYRTKPEAASAGTKALITNKIGDAGFIIALMTIFSLGSNLDISSLDSTTISENYKSIIGMGLLLAAFSKSAQFPFHPWLPDAMQGPTPVSAFIHSATMVAAGVFILIRLQFLLTPFHLQIIAITGATTSVLGGINAIRESDIKKLLAWSTISQLGLMVMTIGNLGFESAYIHLLSHAIFKAGLFLAAGALIINSTDGTLKSLSSYEKSFALVLTMSVLCLSLMGMPLTIGFLSKEYLLSAIASPIYLSLFFLINAFSIFYSVRILSTVLPIQGTTLENKVSGISKLMMIPVVILSIASVWFFYSLSPLSANWIEEMFILKNPSWALTSFSALWGIGLLTAALLSLKSQAMQKLSDYLPDLRGDSYLQTVVVKPVLLIAHSANQVDIKIIDRIVHSVAYINLSSALLAKWVDENWIDGLVQFFVWLTRAIGNFFRQFVTGKIQSYIWWTLVAMALILLFSRS